MATKKARTTSAPAGKPKKRTKAKATRLKARESTRPEKSKKLSALDAAVKVLAETGRAMTCPEMIEAMAAKGYWTSPGGKTPASTLYSAIIRETKTKGKAARFRKTDRGQFTRAGGA